MIAGDVENAAGLTSGGAVRPVWRTVQGETERCLQTTFGAGDRSPTSAGASAISPDLSGDVGFC
eukprot:9485074-Pyramimonas_sp.AAC.1